MASRTIDRIFENSRTSEPLLIVTDGFEFYQKVIYRFFGPARPVPKLGPFEMTTNQQFSVCVCDRAKAAQESQVRLCFWTRRESSSFPP